jgi:hypothetical protein
MVISEYIKAKHPELISDYNDILFRLADKGLIIMQRLQPHGMNVQLASCRIWMELLSMQKPQLTYSDVAALKLPDIYGSAAERLIMKILRVQSQYWLGFPVSTKDTALVIHAKKKQLSFTNMTCHDIVSTDPFHIVNALHKELNENGKDCFGADGIVLKNTNKSNLREVEVIRIQLKLGSSDIKCENDSNSKCETIARIFLDMKTRGRIGNELIQQAGYNIVGESYVLITTRTFLYSQPDEMVKLTQLLEGDTSLKFLGQKELSNIWPEYLKNIGQPYGATGYGRW